MQISIARTVAVALVLASSARATTIVVDANGSGSFTDIGPAIAAAQAGDVLVVLPGNYSGFTLGKGLTIIGYGTAHVVGLVSVTGIPANERAALVNLEPYDLSVTGCLGPVILQEIPSLTSTLVSQCADVRLLEVVSFSLPTPVAPGASIQGARVEIAASVLSGSNPGGSCCSSLDGGDGLVCDSGSRVHLVRSDCRGGGGMDQYDASSTAGDGGYGIVTDGDLILAGGRQSTISGGEGGFDFYPSAGCWLDGEGRSAVYQGGGSVWYSGANIVGAYDVIPSAGCAYVQTGPFAGPGTQQAVSPDDPTLSISGTPASGEVVTITLLAPPGATAILYFGRKPILVVDPTIRIEQLVPRTRVLNFGTVPASGQIVLNLTIPTVWAAGQFLGAQAEITLHSGEVRRTNSLPIVVR